MGSNTTLSSKCRCRNCCSIAWAEDLPIHSACFRCSKKDRSRATLDEPSKVSIRLRFNVSGSTPDQLRFSLRRASHRPASSSLRSAFESRNLWSSPWCPLSTHKKGEPVPIFTTPPWRLFQQQQSSAHRFRYVHVHAFIHYFTVGRKTAQSRADSFIHSFSAVS